MLAVYFVIKGKHAEHFDWGLDQVKWLHANDRMFEARYHVHTLLYNFGWAVGRERRRRAPGAGARPPVLVVGRSDDRARRRRRLARPSSRGSPRTRRHAGDRPDPVVPADPVARERPRQASRGSTTCAGDRCCCASATTPRPHAIGRGHRSRPTALAEAEAWVRSCGARRSARRSPAPTPTPTNSGELAVRRALERLLSPGRLGSLELRNRIVLCPMGTNLAEPDGTVGDDQAAWFEARARGGAAVVLVGSASVAIPPVRTGLGRSRSATTGSCRDSSGSSATVHRHGAAIAAQLVHDGSQSMLDIAEGRPLLVPSKRRPPDTDELSMMLTPDEAAGMMAPFFTTPTFAALVHGRDRRRDRCARYWCNSMVTSGWRCPFREIQQGQKTE